MTRLLLVFCLPALLAAAPITTPSTLPARYAPDVSELARIFDQPLRRSRYMESTECHDIQLPGWENFPTKRYTYKVKDQGGAIKTADVVLLDPTAEQIARWIVVALVEVKGTYTLADGRKIFRHILSQSGGQFPVAGVVYEDIQPHDGQFEIYCFRDGVTVQIDGIPHSAPVQLSPIQMQTAITGGQVTRIYNYARIQSTSPDQWLAFGGSPEILHAGKPTQKWLDTVRTEYQHA